MEFRYSGEIAAMGTVLCWTASALFFEAAGRRIGSLSVNMLRLALALVFFSVMLSVTHGSPIPRDFPLCAWGWLALSGLIGFTLGDMMLFRAFVEVGPRVAMLVMTLVPPMTALIGFSLLGETYSARQWLGMGVTLVGIIWVVVERPDSNGSRASRASRPITVRGVLLALGGAVGQAVAVVMSKHGMGRLNPFAATQIRVIAGTVGFCVLFVLIGWWPRVRRSMANRRAMLLTTAGAAAGPFLGVGLLMVALQHTSTGVATTLVALVPVALGPAARVIDKERVSIRSLLGTLVAIAGVALLLGNS